MRSAMVGATLLLVLGAGAVAAQNKPIELGLDGGLSFKVDDPTGFTISLPVQAFRVGFFTSERVSIEPKLAWNLVKPEGSSSVYTLEGEFGVLYHFAADASRSRAYLRPFAGVDLLGALGESASQVFVGGGVGVKFPVRNRLGMRLEGGLQHGFDTDDFPSNTSIYVLLGFSFMAR